MGALALAAPRYQARLPEPPPPADLIALTGDPVPDSLIRRAIARTPFRASRSPAAVAYDPDRGLVEAEEAPQIPKPRLALAGIVWEPEPAAVIEGLPGTDGGTVVRRGEMVGDLRVKRIERDRVVITGRDTTWNLSVKEPWQ
jgi:hypothetical protein